MIGSHPAQPMRSIRNLLLVVALGGVAIAVPVFAQQPSDYPPPCDGSKITKGDVDRAHTVFLSGKQFLEESNYDKAISYFKDAYSIDCSRHAMLPIIATAYERKGDKGEAVRALDEYLKRAPEAPDHDVIERRIRNLKDQLAREPPPPTASAPAPTASASSSAPPPVATAPAEGTTASSPSASASAPPPRAEGHGVAPWVMVGVGGAVALAGVALFGAGAGDLSNAENQCPDHMHCASASAVDQGNKGRSLERAGGVVIGGGLAIVAAGLVWHLLEKPADHSGGAPATGAHVTPVVAPGYAGVSVGAHF
jgi:tetratricopeptide (TPR) repeat protein